MIIIHQLNRQKHQKMPTFAVFKRRQHLKLRLYCPQRGNQSCAALLKMWCIRNWLCLAFLRAWLRQWRGTASSLISCKSRYCRAKAVTWYLIKYDGFWLVIKRDALETTPLFPHCGRKFPKMSHFILWKNGAFFF